MEFSAEEPPEYHRLVDEAMTELERKGDPLRASEHFSRASILVPPGFERAFVLGQIASISREAGQPQHAINILLSEPDWPYHVPAAFSTLTRAGVEARSVEAFRWLATRPSEHHKAGLEPVDNGIRIALRGGLDIGFADQLVDLAAELVTGEDPRIPLFCGLVREKQEKPDEAIKAYMAAAELGGTDSRIYRRLTLLLDKHKRREEAKEWCRRALEVELNAAARQEIEKRLSRLEAAPGARQQLSSQIVPLYVRAGVATIERVAAFPVQVTKAVQGPDSAWGLGTRRKQPHLFIAQIGAGVLEVPLPFKPLLLLLAAHGERCLVIEFSSDGVSRAALVADDGQSHSLELSEFPRNVVSLLGGWLAAFRLGGLEQYTWSGEIRWTSQLPGAGTYAHFLAADSQIALASHMNRIYEIVPETGEIRGSAVIEPKPSESSAGPFRVTIGLGDRSAWVTGLAVDGGRGLVIARDEFFEVKPGPRLVSRESFSGLDHVQIPMCNDAGRPIAFQGNDAFRSVQADGSLGSAIPCPWRRHGLARLRDQGFISYGGRCISVLDANGQETHRLEAATEVRSLEVIGTDACRAVIGKDVLSMTFS